MRRRLPPLIAFVLLAATALAGCGSSGGDAGSRSTSPGSWGSPGSGTPTSAGSSPAVPLTAQGTKLKLGQKAKMAWRPTQRAEGVLGVTVTKLESTSY